MTGIEIFKNEKFGEIRVAGTGEQPLFCLADVCKSIGIKDVSRCASRLDDDMRLTHPIIDNLGRTQHATFVTESGLYDVIIRSDSESAKPFRKWITEEVLPSIRKTGGYMIAKDDETPEETMARALLIANDTIKRKNERIKHLEHSVASLKPKAELMQKVLDSDERIDIGQSAKILELPFGRNTLFKKLREMGVFFKNKNEPKQEYIQRGYFILKEKWIDYNNHDGFTVLKVLVTQKGLEFLANLFADFKKAN